MLSLTIFEIRRETQGVKTGIKARLGIPKVPLHVPLEIHIVVTHQSAPNELIQLNQL